VGTRAKQSQFLDCGLRKTNPISPVGPDPGGRNAQNKPNSGRPIVRNKANSAWSHPPAGRNGVKQTQFEPGGQPPAGRNRRNKANLPPPGGISGASRDPKREERRWGARSTLHLPPPARQSFLSGTLAGAWSMSRPNAANASVSFCNSSQASTGTCESPRFSRASTTRLMVSVSTSRAG